MSALILCGIALLGGVFVSPMIMWDGGFKAAEYRVTLRTRTGDLINDADLHVTDSKGNPADRYPILEYSAGIPVVSNDDGVFVFHQVRSGFQFGGRYMNLFGFIPIGRRTSPAFEMVFMRDGNPIISLDFRNLDDGIDFSSAERVRRTFTLAETLHADWKESLSEEELSQVAIEREFPIVERTITVNLKMQNKGRRQRLRRRLRPDVSPKTYEIQVSAKSQKG